MILLINNKSAFICDIRSSLKKLNAKYEEIHYSAQIDANFLNRFSGIIFSGGPGIPAERELRADIFALKNAKSPILGICLGHQLIALEFGAKIGKMHEKDASLREITIDKKDILFDGFEKKLKMRESHEWFIPEVPKNFEILAHSAVCPVEAIRHKKRPIYGVQFHPEASGNDGLLLLKNFLRICSR